MTMHTNDPETILALLDGTLDPSREGAVRAHMADCAECAAELEMQQAALEALHGAPRAFLTAAESADLHRTMHRALGLARPPERRPRRRPFVSRVAVLAGVTAVLIGILTVAPHLTFLASDDASDITIAAAQAQRDESTPATPVPGNDLSAVSDAAPLGDAMTEETTRASMTLGPVPDLDTVRRDVIAAGGDALKATDRLETDGEDAGVPMAGGDAAEDAGPCVDTGLAELPDTVTAFIVADAMSDNGEVLVIAYVPADVEDTVVLSHLLPTCVIVDRSP
jgi:anti-sigma factor RsiW